MPTAIAEYVTHATEFSIDERTFIINTLNGTSTNNYSISTGWSCTSGKDIQHTIFQLANFSLTLAYISSATKKGVLMMHCLLILGLSLFCGWAWNIICAPDVFVWNFLFLLINIGQVFYNAFQVRPVQFDPELEEIYRNLYEPFKIPRLQFKRIVSSDYAQIMSLHAGEAYAVQNLTKTDRLGLLLSGKVNVVMSENQFLHPILPCEFMDSPEFESSRNTSEDKFNVSIVAASTCRYIFWQRTALEYLFVKEPYVATVMTTLIARDVTVKLYSMNNKIFTTKGSNLDIRLPSITPSFTLTDEYKSPIRVQEKGQHYVSKHLYEEKKYHKLANEKDTFSGMTPLRQAEVPLLDDLPSNDVESWIETSSKYHSCELVDLD